MNVGLNPAFPTTLEIVMTKVKKPKARKVSLKEHFDLVMEYLEYPGPKTDSTPFKSLQVIKRELNKTKKLLREATKK